LLFPTSIGERGTSWWASAARRTVLGRARPWRGRGDAVANRQAPCPGRSRASSGRRRVGCRRSKSGAEKREKEQGGAFDGNSETALASNAAGPRGQRCLPEAIENQRGPSRGGDDGHVPLMRLEPQQLWRRSGRGGEQQSVDPESWRWSSRPRVQSMLFGAARRTRTFDELRPA